MKPWKEIRDSKLSPEARTRVDAWVENEILEMNLRAVRDLVGLTQAQAADQAGITQAEVSRMERRDDNRLSTLRRYIESLGGELELRAVFKDKTVRLSLGADAK